MKKVFLIVALLSSILSYGQVSQGGQRICGDEFSAYGVAGMTLSQALDWAGQTHNEYQETLLQKFSVIKPNFTDTTALKEIIVEKSKTFFSAKGLDYNENVHILNLGKATPLEVQQNVYSREGFSIINKLKNQLISYDANNDADFFTTLQNLKEGALNLSDKNEAFTVGVPISIAIHSLTYWKANGQKWLNLFTAYDQVASVGNSFSTPASSVSINYWNANDQKGPSRFVGNDQVINNSNIFLTQTSSLSKQPTVSLAKIGGADVVGAVSGAIGGSVLGPGGSLAMGVLGSATSSLGNLCNQIISHYVSWWPF